MLKAYLKDTGGNFAIIFSLVVFGIAIAVGVSIDTAGMTQEKNKLQSLADIAALAAARSGFTTEEELLVIATDAVEANSNMDMSITPTLIITPDNVIRVTLSGEYDPAILGIISQNHVPINTVAEVPLPSESTIDLALVLDTTGSMQGEKIESLKTAATALVNILEQRDSDTRIAVVPFSQYVNIGEDNRGVDWIDVEEDTQGEETCQMLPRTTSECDTEERTGYNDGVPYTYTANINCVITEHELLEFCHTPQTAWHGCIGSREEPWNRRPQHANRDFPGIMNRSCSSEMLPLTTDLDAVRTKITGLFASGQTYMPAGLQWGWRALDIREPYMSNEEDQAATKALIFMTDGKNTVYKDEERHNPFSPGTYQASDGTVFSEDQARLFFEATSQGRETYAVQYNITLADVNNIAFQYEYQSDLQSRVDESDDLTRRLCNRIKREDITVFTVFYRFEGENTRRLIRRCATSRGHFFNANNADELVAAFESIADSLGGLRLSR